MPNLYQRAEKEKKCQKTAADECRNGGNQRVHHAGRRNHEQYDGYSGQTGRTFRNRNPDDRGYSGKSRGGEGITKLANNSAETAEEIRQISALVVGAVEALSGEAEKMLTFLEEETVEGFGKLVDTGEQYKSDSAKIHTMMSDFTKEFEEFKDNMEKIKDSLAAVTIAVDDSTNAIVSITQTSEQLSRNAESLKQDADKNLMIADALKNESGKFKI